MIALARNLFRMVSPLPIASLGLACGLLAAGWMGVFPACAAGEDAGGAGENRFEEFEEFAETARVLGHASAAEQAARALAENPSDLALRGEHLEWVVAAGGGAKLDAALGAWDASSAQKTAIYWLHRGRRDWEAEGKERALEAWRTGALLPGGGACFRELAWKLWERRDWAGVDRLCGEVLAAGPDQAELLIWRHAARMRMGRWDEAGGDLKRAAELEPEAQGLKGHYPVWERFERVRPQIDALGKKAAAGASPGPLIERAALFHAIGLPDAALEDVRAARKLAGGSDTLALLEAQAAFRAGFPVKEAAAIEPGWKKNDGDLLWQRGEIARLMALEERAKKGGAEGAAARVERAEAFRRWDQPAFALREAEAALAGGVAGTARARALGEKGFALVSLGDSASGYAAYREALEAGLDDVALLQAGMSHAKSRGEYEAVAAFAARGKKTKAASDFAPELLDAKRVMEGTEP